MIQLHIQKREDLNALISFRKGERKLGEIVNLCDSLEKIKESTTRFVIFGISESIGVQANYGNSGTQKAWKTFLKAFVNVQSNLHNDVNSILVLGNITVTPTNPINRQTSKQELGDIVARVDSKVAFVVETIVAAGKIPIIIGGGHNNGFGNLKGTYQALQTPINAINIDAHSDLRRTDYRHSGNGFSYALENEPNPFLNKYAIFGLHKNYTPQYIFEYMNDNNNRISYALLEKLLEQENPTREFERLLSFVNEDPFGLELDCDAITHFPSSAQSPSGFTLNEVRQLITKAAQNKSCTYFHICEAAPSKNNKAQVGKALSYLVTDFIRSYNEHHTVS